MIPERALGLADLNRESICGARKLSRIWEISMKIRTICALIAASLAATPASAQEWSDEQSEVWAWIVSAWDEHSDPGTWAEVLDEDGYGMNGSYPVPTSQAEMARGAAKFGAEGKVLHHRLDPLAVTVSGDTAVVYYYAGITEENFKGERENNTDKCADVLIKREGDWRFLGWHCITLDGD